MEELALQYGPAGAESTEGAEGAEARQVQQQGGLPSPSLPMGEHRGSGLPGGGGGGRSAPEGEGVNLLQQPTTSVPTGMLTEM